MRLIDEDALIEDIKHIIANAQECDIDAPTWEEQKERLKAVKSANVAPVRHGRWIWLGPICDKFGEVEGRAFKCSACNYVLGIYHNSEFYRYCPSCGAKMEGE